MLKKVFKFPNGMVVAFDENGEQIPELQGRYADVREKVIAASNDDTEFNGWPGRGEAGRRDHREQRDLPG